MTPRTIVFASLLVLPFLGFAAFPTSREEFFVVYEVVLSVATSFVLGFVAYKTQVQQHRRKLLLLSAGLVSAAIAEGTCGINFLRDNVGVRGSTSAELLYVFFWMSLVTVMRWHFGPLFSRRNVVFTIAAPILFVAASWVQLQFMFPSISIGEMVTLRHVHLLVWVFSRSAAVVLAMSYSCRALTGQNFLFLDSVVALYCTGLSAAYQAVTVSRGGLFWFEASWAAALGGIFMSVFPGKSVSPFSERSRLSPWYSIRAMLSISVFLATILVIAGAAVSDLLTEGHGVNISLLPLVAFLSWCTSNYLALRTVQYLQQAIAAAPTPEVALARAADAGLMTSSIVRRSDLLAEFREPFLKNERLTLETARLTQAAMRAEREAEIGRLAAQVAHDIRGPVAALQMALKDSVALPAETRKITRAAIARVQDIANNLLAKNRRDACQHSDVEEPPTLLVGLVEGVVSEKRTKHRGNVGISISVQGGSDCTMRFVKCNKVAIASALANLIDNAVEALAGQGAVSVVLGVDNEYAKLAICDNGAGIDPKILPQLGQRGATFNKQNGNGLGLYGARVACESVGGRLSIHSELGRGTQIAMYLPLCAPPGWFASELDLTHVNRVVVVDDDHTTYQMWEKCFRDRNIGVGDLIHLGTIDEFAAWVDVNGHPNNVQYLVDYEFDGSATTGLQMIEALQLQSNSLLVSGRAEEAAVVCQVQQASIMAIPKEVVPYLPIAGRPTVPAVAG